MPYHYNDRFICISYDDNPYQDYVVVYTDGACSNNGKPNAKAGIGVWFNNNHHLNFSGPVQGNPTNNVAEIEAAIEAISIADNEGITHLTIRTDSHFLVDSVTKWVPKWRRNNWRKAGGNLVVNREEFKELVHVIKSMDDVQFEFVPSHDGDEGNEEADRLARAGAKEY